MSELRVVEGSEETVECEVCVLGAGIAGLNALFAASRHVSARDKLVIVDRRAAPAGMWNSTYGYVRLHQAHPMFTAGNIRWRDQPDPYHLATRDEVVGHLQHCFEQISKRAALDPRFGYTYLRHEEGSRQWPVTVFCRRDADGAELRIHARFLIKAFGYDIVPLQPLALSSQRVRSLAPESADLLQQVRQQGDAPIYVVGGGKTGMDTAHMLVRELPQRKVRALIGEGTMFLDRDKVNPGRWRRHFAGVTPLEAFLDIARRFDGRNEAVILDHLRQEYCVSLDASCRRFMFGVMSPRENRELRDGLDEVIKDHLVDVVDEAGGPVLVLRSGRRRPIEPGAVFVNCAGYLKAPPYEPYLSASGHVLSIQPSSTVHFLSSMSAFLLTHMLMLGKLAEAPLYQADMDTLRDASRDAFPAAAITLTLYNVSVIARQLPRWVLAENGLDPIALFPWHRRLLALLRLMVFLKRHPHQLRSTLDVVRERFPVKLGPLAHAPSRAQPPLQLDPAPSHR